MSVFDTKKNPAICVLPWVHEFKTITGDVAPCCLGHSLRDDESIEIIRKQMLEGTKPRACNKCYHTEAESNWSPRIHETIDWIKKFGEPSMDEIKLEFVDIRFNPTCNLKCKTCGPESSTLWQKERNVKIPINNANKNYLNNINKKHLKKVYLAGGEPTYINEYKNFLEELFVVNPECELVINSNLKKLPLAWKQIMIKFKNLTVICSCDAIETLGSYLRYPLEWNEFEENVKFACEHANFFVFNLVASNLNSHKLYETCTWMKKFSKNINISILRGPEHFSESAVPTEYRNTYIENITKLSKFPVSVHYAMNFRNNIQHLIKKYSESSYNESLHKSLSTEITDQDRHRSLALQDVDTFLCNWIYR